MAPTEPILRPVRRGMLLMFVPGIPTGTGTDTPARTPSPVTATETTTTTTADVIEGEWKEIRASLELGVLELNRRRIDLADGNQFAPPSLTVRNNVTCIELKNRKESLLLRAKTEKEFVEWVAAISHAAAQHEGLLKYTRQERVAKAYIGRVFSWTAMAEVISGFFIMNILLILQSFASGPLEYWLFFLALNLFVSWCLMTRFDHVLTHDMLQQALYSKVTYSEVVRGGGNVIIGDRTHHSGSVSDGSEQEDLPLHHAAAGAHNLDDTMLTNDVSAATMTARPGSSTAVHHRYHSDDEHVIIHIPPFESGLTYLPPNRPMVRHSWTMADTSKVSVRLNPAGLTGSSGPPFMKLLACDIGFSPCSFSSCVSESAGYLPNPTTAFPPPSYSSVTSPPPPSLRIPKLLVFNILVQKPHSAVFTTENGPAYHLVLVFEPSDGFIHELMVDELHPETVGAAKLASTFLTNAESYIDRLQAMGEILNPQNSNVPPWTLKFNSVPTSLQGCRVHHLKDCITQQGATIDVLEIQIDLRTWSVLSRQVANAVLPSLSKLDFQLAFYLKGGASMDEFPERVLCGARLGYLDIAQAKTWGSHGGES